MSLAHGGVTLENQSGRFDAYPMEICGLYDDSDLADLNDGDSLINFSLRFWLPPLVSRTNGRFYSVPAEIFGSALLSPAPFSEIGSNSRDWMSQPLDQPSI